MKIIGSFEDHEMKRDRIIEVLGDVVHTDHSTYSNSGRIWWVHRKLDLRTGTLSREGSVRWIGLQNWLKEIVPSNLPISHSLITLDREIGYHRDSGPTHRTGILVNMGSCEFRSRRTKLELSGGEIVRFNSHEDHKITNVVPGRMGIVIWYKNYTEIVGTRKPITRS